LNLKENFTISGKPQETLTKFGQSRRKIDNFVVYLNRLFKVSVEKAVWIKELFFDSVEKYISELSLPLETTRETSMEVDDDIVRTPKIEEIGESREINAPPPD
jgi:hypothetical protein